MHKLLSGGPKRGVLGGAQKVYVAKVYVLFRSPKKGLKIGIFRRSRVFLGTFLPTPKKTFFETFLRFRALRARRLL